MSSESNNNSNATPPKRELFHFGEYISPNPRSIPLNINLQPAASIEYETNKMSKTESKPQIVNKTNEKETKSVGIIPPTPLNVKVGRQQHQIELLQSQILKLQLENERLKSASNSPENEAIANEDSRTPKSKHIAFNPSVRVMDSVPHAKDMRLNDKASVMRAKRNATPYKSIPVSVPKPLTRNVMNVLKQQQQERENTHESSRSHYRITPIPQKRKQIRFKSKLETVCDKENTHCTDADTQQEMTTDGATAKEKVPTVMIPDQHLDLDKSATFNLLGSSQTPSFLRTEATPDQSPSVKSRKFGGFTANGNGASNASSPIVTPIKGSDINAKPFTFSWNKRK